MRLTVVLLARSYINTPLSLSVLRKPLRSQLLTVVRAVFVALLARPEAAYGTHTDAASFLLFVPEEERDERYEKKEEEKVKQHSKYGADGEGKGGDGERGGCPWSEVHPYRIPPAHLTQNPVGAS